MAATDETYQKEIKKARFYIEEMEETLDTFDKDELTIAHEKVIKLYKSLEGTIDAVTGVMLEVISHWTR